MKKAYIIPTMEVVRMMTMQVLAGSGSVTGKDIGYGGVDTSGNMNPSSPHYHGVDEEDEEDEEDW